MKKTTRENKEKLKTSQWTFEFYTFYTFIQNSFIGQRVFITVLILFKHQARNEMSFLRATLKNKKEKHENNAKSEELIERPSTGKKYALSTFLLCTLFARTR